MHSTTHRRTPHSTRGVAFAPTWKSLTLVSTRSGRHVLVTANQARLQISTRGCASTKARGVLILYPRCWGRRRRHRCFHSHRHHLHHHQPSRERVGGRDQAAQATTTMPICHSPTSFDATQISNVTYRDATRPVFGNASGGYITGGQTPGTTHHQRIHLGRASSLTSSITLPTSGFGFVPRATTRESGILPKQY